MGNERACWINIPLASVRLLFCLSVYLCVCPSVYVSVCLSVYISAFLCIFLIMCPVIGSHINSSHTHTCINPPTPALCVYVRLSDVLSHCLSVYMIFCHFLHKLKQNYVTLCIAISKFLSHCLSACLTFCHILFMKQGNKDERPQQA